MTTFSVLMPVYYKDDPFLFDRAILSVLSNNLIPNKIVIVVDGSLTTALEKILEKYRSNDQFLIIRNPINLGLSKALNIGLKHIDHEYTIRADSDDYNHSERFNLLINKLQEGYDLVGSTIKEVDKFGNFIAYKQPPCEPNLIRQYVKQRNPFNHPSVAFKTKTVKSLGGYPHIFQKEDYALWATLIANKYPICNIDNILVDATTGSDMFKRRSGLKYALAEIELQKYLIKLGLKNKFNGLIDGMLRSIVFLAPNYIRKFIYLNFLR